MKDWLHELYMLQARSGRHRKVLREAQEIIVAVLKHMTYSYIAFSCGKDSSVLAHIVLQIDSSVPLRFLSSGETRLVHNVDLVLDYFRDLGAEIQEINIDRVFADGWQEASWDEQRKAGKGDLEKLNTGGWDGIFMGLRAQESGRRKRTLWNAQTPGLPPFCYRYIAGKRLSMIRCCPLARWATEDIGAYLITNNIPWLDWYDYHEYGFEGRTTARLTGDAARQNALAWLKLHKPENFNYLAERFPEFRLYV